MKHKSLYLQNWVTEVQLHISVCALVCDLAPLVNTELSNVLLLFLMLCTAALLLLISVYTLTQSHPVQHSPHSWLISVYTCIQLPSNNSSYKIILISTFFWWQFGCQGAKLGCSYVTSLHPSPGGQTKELSTQKRWKTYRIFPHR